MKRKSKAVKCFLGVVSICLVCFAFVCVIGRASAYFDNPDYIMLASAKTTLTGGEYKYANENKSVEKDSEIISVKQPQIRQDDIEPTQSESQNKRKTNRTGEKTYPVEEININYGETDGYDNFLIKNTTDFSFDPASLLEKDLPFDFSDTREIQVLIVHTHAEESYLEDDDGFYYESFYPRSEDDEKNMVQVGEAIAKSLKKNNIGVVHDKTHHDKTYTGAYDRSRETIMKYVKKYPNIKVILDIHRDSMTKSDNTKLKPTFTYDGKKGAQIMIMTGYDEDGSYNYPNWNDNLIFALKLQQAAETMYPGMTRPLYFGDFVYNLNVNTGSLLIEVGTDANTLDEAKYTGELLANALSQVLQS